MTKFIWLGFKGDLFYWCRFFPNGWKNSYVGYRVGPFSIRQYDKKF